MNKKRIFFFYLQGSIGWGITESNDFIQNSSHFALRDQSLSLITEERFLSDKHEFSFDNTNLH